MNLKQTNKKTKQDIESKAEQPAFDAQDQSGLFCGMNYYLDTSSETRARPGGTRLVSPEQAISILLSESLPNYITFKNTAKSNQPFNPNSIYQDVALLTF